MAGLFGSRDFSGVLVDDLASEGISDSTKSKYNNY